MALLLIIDAFIDNSFIIRINALYFYHKYRRFCDKN